MNKLVNNKLLLILPIILISLAIMSFEIFEKNELNSTPPDFRSLNGPVITNCEISVTQNCGNVYVLSYLEHVTSFNMTPGCGYIDLVPSTSGFDCSGSGYGFVDNSGIGCEFIEIHSSLRPTEGNPVLHTIDYKVKDNNGLISNQGEIKLWIYYDRSASYYIVPTLVCGGGN